ncbi:acyl carrier protein [Streptomyces sp.]|uniref:acyl carrier protein n=1 Tax=Streptomyces sp. TaxID=1931 RepID=UPI002D58CC02|nr:acyl carrier protein [Streptomyces sp.]HZF89582.1 acyl carrier protein [Streptomyces sp.]
MESVDDLCALIQEFAASPLSPAAGREPGLEVTSDLRLLDTGLLDSMSVLTLVVEIEQRCGIRIPEEEMVAANFRTPAHLWDLVSSLRAQTV